MPVVASSPDGEVSNTFLVDVTAPATIGITISPTSANVNATAVVDPSKTANAAVTLSKK